MNSTIWAKRITSIYSNFLDLSRFRNKSISQLTNGSSWGALVIWNFETLRMFSYQVSIVWLDLNRSMPYHLSCGLSPLSARIWNEKMNQISNTYLRPINLWIQSTSIWALVRSLRDFKKKVHRWHTVPGNSRIPSLCFTLWHHSTDF